MPKPGNPSASFVPAAEARKSISELRPSGRSPEIHQRASSQQPKPGNPSTNFTSYVRDTNFSKARALVQSSGKKHK
ncbi:hypothetical protein Tco_0664999 [Tanacetum coccineum]